MTEYEEMREKIADLIRSYFTPLERSEQIMLIVSKHLIDHYWDSLENHRDILESHIKAVLIRQPDNVPTPSNTAKETAGKWDGFKYR